MGSVESIGSIRLIGNYCLGFRAILKPLLRV